MPAARPLIEEVSLPAPAAEVFGGLAERAFSFFLDSGMDAARLGRYSFMGAEPFLVLRSVGDEITLIRGEAKEVRRGNPFDVLGELLDAYRLERTDGPVPFVGGAVGYFAYDLGRFIEKVPATASDDLRLPECYLGFYDVILAVDHVSGTAYLISTGFPEREESARLKRARERMEWLRGQIEGGSGAGPPQAAPPATGKLKIRGNFSHQAYLAAVARAREYICAGDIFEVNLSQRFQVPLPVPPYELYQRLRAVNPAPFASYFNFEGVSIVGASPERYLKLTGDRVETRPIKGTKPRGTTPEEDRALADALVASKKDRAENIMIVDLERNDLGRVCRYGTVKVTELCALETWPTVFHLTSTVEGRLREGRGVIDLLKATFPGGSITGAPKVRAMEIIEELEPNRRGPYTGSLGYIGFDGDADLDIVIRTIIVRDGTAYFQVGGAVVYDSDPESEYLETLDKGRAMMRALAGAGDAEVELPA